MGGKGVCLRCDCARLLWGESLTLYLLLGTTCLPLLDTGSLHPHPNVKTPHIRVCLVLLRPKAKSDTSIIINSRTGSLSNSHVYEQMIHVRPSSPFCSFSGIKDLLMDTSVGPGWQQLLASIEDWAEGRMFKPGAEVQVKKNKRSA